jgi:hypothetical protein
MLRLVLTSGPDVDATLRDVNDATIHGDEVAEELHATGTYRDPARPRLIETRRAKRRETAAHLDRFHDPTR